MEGHPERHIQGVVDQPVRVTFMTEGSLAARLGWGTPTTFVLYRTLERWRYATYFREPASFLDGAVPGVPSSSVAELAQAELHRQTERAHERRYHVNWKAADKPEWWIGEICDMGPLPASSN